jgi:hypothetical protein
MISIFAKPPFEMRHLQRVSSIIRGEQITSYMYDARLNPESGYKDDICIYVKPAVKPGNDFHFEKHSYIDTHDDYELRHILRMHPEVGCLAMSDHAATVWRRKIRNKIIVLPQHHLNLEREKRDRDTVINVGITGSPDAFKFIPEEIRTGLAKRGMRLIEWSQFFPRSSVAKFHKGLDIHLEWRPWPKKLSAPFKITHAASFGIPTIALITEEPSFYEVEGAYIGVNSVEEFFKELDTLRTADTKETDRYKEIAKKCLEIADRYYIGNIAKLYRQLT